LSVVVLVVVGWLEESERQRDRGTTLVLGAGSAVDQPLMLGARHLSTKQAVGC